jgi:hypothetical protein
VLCIRNFSKILGCAFLLMVFIAGCSSLGQVQSREIKPLKTREMPSGHGWWYARFRMQWPPDTQPIWYMDLYLAHQVILPKLEKYKENIDLWRFHRRAGRDGAGRQFSFIFYASPRTARQIFNALKTDPLVAYLKAEGVLERDVYDDPTQIIRPDIEDTSDKNWPASIQKTWPFYIMGASQMWLNLISEIAEKNLTDDPPASVAEIGTFYQQVNEIITELWQKEGRHAYMHHLNALFEYQPLIYREKQYLSF